MPRRKPDIPLILIAVFLILLTAFVYIGTYFSVFRFFAQRVQYLPATLMALLLAFIFTATCIILVMEREDPSRTLLWLLILLAFPVVGFILYMIFGQRLIRRQKVIRRLRRVQRLTGPMSKSALILKPGLSMVPAENFSPGDEERFAAGSVQMRMSQLIYNSNGSLLTWSNWVQVLNDGVHIFPAMLAVISEATHHVHLESYIFRDDELGKLFFDLLAEKAAAGVQVRIIIDGVGSLGLGQARMEELEALGIEIKVHFPIKFSIFRNRLNYRNHRKILVVDGRTCFVGGANIGNDYLGLYSDIGNWRDTQLLIHGPAAAELQRLFFQDWVTISGELPGDNPGRFFPSFTDNNDLTAENALPNYPSSLGKVAQVINRVRSENAAAGTKASSKAALKEAPRPVPGAAPGTASGVVPGFISGGALSPDSLMADESALLHFQPEYTKAVQIASSGPDSPYASIMQAYHYAITTAKDVVNITSPYFIPNQSILTALKTAALAGVDVNLLVPQNPDQQMVYLAALTYIEDLMDDGVRVWLYNKGFLHSKIMTVDDTIAIVGTANMDQRSFALNFEVNALVYDKKTVDELSAAFRRDLEDSTPLDPAKFRKRPLYRRILESGCRLLSPLL